MSVARQHVQTNGKRATHLSGRDHDLLLCLLPPFLQTYKGTHFSNMAYQNHARAGPSNANGVTYDPDQDPSQRREIRKQYRNLKAEIEGRAVCSVEP